MHRINIIVNDKTYNVQVACTEKDREKGLQNVPSLPKNEGMLFVFDHVQDVGFWMKNTHVALDIIFINEDEEVLKITEGEPLSENLISCKDVKYVLELNADSRVKQGDQVDLCELDEMEDDDDENCIEVVVKINLGESGEKKNMIVLDSDGETQMELGGGERIFSRSNTKTMINMAKRANRTKKDNDYKRLGAKVFEFINTQDNRKPDYVELPK